MKFFAPKNMCFAFIFSSVMKKPSSGGCRRCRGSNTEEGRKRLFATFSVCRLFVCLSQTVDVLCQT